MNKPNKANRKVIEINKLVNQFTSSMQHKPFNNDIDKARALAFIKAIREVLAIGPPKHHLVDAPWNGIQVDEATLAENARQIALIREKLRRSSKDE